MKKDSQLTMSFPAQRKPRAASAASRILKNFRKQKNKERDGIYQLFRRDSFLSFNGAQVF